MTEEDINYAQGLLLEAIDETYNIGYAKITFTSFYGRVPGSFTDVTKLAKGFTKKAAEHWFQHLGTKDLSKAEISDTVRNAIANDFRPALTNRQSLGRFII